MSRQQSLHSIVSQRQDAEAVARAYGDVPGGAMVTCDGCGVILDSTVVDAEPHRADCPGVCEHAVSHDKPCARCDPQAERSLQAWGDLVDRADVEPLQ